MVRGLLKLLKKRNRKGCHRMTRRQRKSRPRRWKRKSQYSSQALDMTTRRQQEAEAGHALGRAWPNQVGYGQVLDAPARFTGKINRKREGGTAGSLGVLFRRVPGIVAGLLGSWKKSSLVLFFQVRVSVFLSLLRGVLPPFLGVHPLFTAP
ncbi:hypothetical protein NDU88_004765 [Pleurodeles waltl]|uniref:Uncharacterized protein n=1 Tax=Pleurodeles waltl TaxID=8319 RepID=A0AAV7W9V6_PLEWA|nr:hypothetical protein NDU88_004765 [Pleurodeles waltl]